LLIVKVIFVITVFFSFFYVFLLFWWIKMFIRFRSVRHNFAQFSVTLTEIWHFYSAQLLQAYENYFHLFVLALIFLHI